MPPAWFAGPGMIKPGTVTNDFMAIMIGFPPSAQSPAIPMSWRNVPRAITANGKTFKVHLDGYNLMPFLTSAKERLKNNGAKRSRVPLLRRRRPVRGLSQGPWKYLFFEQYHTGLDVWAELHAPPHSESLQPARRPVRACGPSRLPTTLELTFAPRGFVCAGVSAWSSSGSRASRNSPSRQKRASFNLDEVMSKLQEAGKGSN